MTMTLVELLEWLTELQKVCPGTTPTNVEAVRLKGLTTLQYDRPYGYSYDREGKRARELSVWVDSFTDGPQPGSSICEPQIEKLTV